MALHGQGDLERAMSCYRESLRLHPGHADASNNLATALKELGLLDEAIAQYRETLRLQPEHALACFNLSQFVAEGWYHFDRAVLDRIEAHAAGQGPALERSLFCFTLAGVLDREGRIDEAFGYYRQANDLRRGLLQERGQAFDPHRHRAAVDRIIAAFDRTYFQRVQAWGTDTELPVFVIGMPLGQQPRRTNPRQSPGGVRRRRVRRAAAAHGPAGEGGRHARRPAHSPGLARRRHVSGTGGHVPPPPNPDRRERFTSDRQDP